MKMCGSIIEVAVLPVSTASPRSCPVVPPSVLVLMVMVPTCPASSEAPHSQSET